MNRQTSASSTMQPNHVGQHDSLSRGPSCHVPRLAFKVENVKAWEFIGVFVCVCVCVCAFVF